MNNPINKISRSFIKYLILVILIITIGAVNSYSLAEEDIPLDLIRRANNINPKSIARENIKEILPVKEMFFVKEALPNVVNNNLEQSYNTKPPDGGYFIITDSLGIEEAYRAGIPDSIFFRQKEIDEVLSNAAKYDLNQIQNMDFSKLARKAKNKEIIILPVENVQIDSKNIVSIGVADRGLIAFAVDKEAVKKAAQGNSIAQGKVMDTQSLIAFKANEITNIIEKIINLDGFKTADKVEVKDGIVRIVETIAKPKVDLTPPIVVFPEENESLKKSLSVKAIHLEKINNIANGINIPSLIINKGINTAVVLHIAKNTQARVISKESGAISHRDDIIKPSPSREEYKSGIQNNDNKANSFEGVSKGVIEHSKGPPLNALIHTYFLGLPLAYNSLPPPRPEGINISFIPKQETKQEDEPNKRILISAKSDIQQARAVIPLLQSNVLSQQNIRFELHQLKDNLSLTTSLFNNPFLSPPDKVPN